MQNSKNYEHESDDMFTQLGNIGLWCARVFFKTMAFLLLGVVVLSAARDGIRYLTHENTAKSQQTTSSSQKHIKDHKVTSKTAAFVK
jgi:hypothetical protein